MDLLSVQEYSYLALAVALLYEFGEHVQSARFRVSLTIESDTITLCLDQSHVGRFLRAGERYKFDTSK